MKAVGIDPGTKSMDLYGFDDLTGEVIVDEAIPRSKVTENPQVVLDALSGISVDAVMGPGGYGMPTKPAKEASDEEILAATFITEADEKRRLNIVGLRELMFLMRDSPLPIWFPPGVIHLPTVPEYRKLNRIDLGTSDKVFSAAAAIKDQAERLNIPYSKTSFIVLEIGFGYTAAMAVEGGRIVDGVGGSIGGIGFLGGGGMDGELAYALANTGEFPKTLLFAGGAASVAGIDPKEISIEEFISLTEKDPKAKLAYDGMLDAVLKDTFSLFASVPKPKEILLSGRFTKIPAFAEEVSDLLSKRLKTETRVLSSQATSKQAALGAAVLACGLADGKYSSLVENMRLRECSGGVFSHLYMGEETKKKIEDAFTRR